MPGKDLQFLFKEIEVVRRLVTVQRGDRVATAKPAERFAERKVEVKRQRRIALLHALAHIELNAIDLAWDIAARFPGQPRAFYDDWVAVGADEARHFLMLSDRLDACGAAYGDLPAHDGLWQAAMDTADDLLARLAVVPLVLEARGLDVTPAMIERLERAGDDASAAILAVIYREEVGHVATGMRWFMHVCGERGVEPETTWKAIVAQRFRGRIKPPFNIEARERAGLPASYYAAETL